MSEPTLSSMAPLPPQRDPRRALRIKTTSAIPTGISISNEQIDVWDRALELYRYSIHDEQWQVAAEDFTMLAEDIESNMESTLCLLNAAIIFSRLGVFAAVSRVIDQAQPSGLLVSLTMFILAYVELQRENFAKAEDCFKVVLEGLDKSSQDYKCLGLDFTLNVADVRYNLFILRTTKQNRYEVLETLGQLPIEGIFSAPARSEIVASGTTKDRSPTIGSEVSNVDDSEATPSLSNGSSRPSSTASPAGKGYFDDWQGDAWVSSSRSLSNVELASSEAEQRRWSGSFDEKEPSMSLSIVSTGYNPYSLSEGHPDSPSLKRKSTEEHLAAIPTRNFNFEPREARVGSMTTQYLADFVRDLPSSETPEPPSRNPQRTGLEPMFENITIRDDTKSLPPTPLTIHSRHDSANSMPTDIHPALRPIPEQEPAESSEQFSTLRMDNPVSRPGFKRFNSTASIKSGMSAVSKLGSIAPSLNNFHYTWRGGLQYEDLDNPKPPKVYVPPAKPASPYAGHSFFATWGSQMGSLWGKGTMESVGMMARQGNMRTRSIRRGGTKRIGLTSST
ncbi:hypothetical protein CLAFUW4_09923 [Fulvia fulva]|uniref:Uncharacterized protein n=1 Tax=Passalora fulva TaxID=5499 RepID=A0A9Q8PHS8_PASFU|nr:uncharacterized protein CLAFUR5_12320 [Fulvia fulva]KAK4617302.1 hypothetical protein CLAFUR0_09922 [Fulvia fulva]UJO22761.1 hypothetical protein CLAFUR5_12320 [Fulvia fulva]WPV19016.1 hypothetical protein CLAFUW4_09923 [Fulvia fulva]